MVLRKQDVLHNSLNVNLFVNCIKIEGLKNLDLRLFFLNNIRLRSIIAMKGWIYMLKKIFNKYTIIGGVLLFLFILLLILLMTVDRANNIYKQIGLFSFNKLFLVDYSNEAWDEFSDVILYISLLFILGLAIYGFYQLSKKRSLFKVDKDIIFIGCGLAILAFVWLVFDKLIDVNYRPIAISGTAQTSFPSTHTMIAAFVLLAATRAILKRNGNEIKYQLLAYSGSSILILLCSLGRILSKMHWATDVLGGLFIGVGLFFILVGLDKAFEKDYE